MPSPIKRGYPPPTRNVHWHTSSVRMTICSLPRNPKRKPLPALSIYEFLLKKELNPKTVKVLIEMCKEKNEKQKLTNST